ncbi:MAG: class II fructose-bisphosphate aldolase [Chloroflexi bacterium]|nr:class II fructose-bisphosphate aldolase [Chloroflexota bacterium]
MKFTSLDDLLAGIKPAAQLQDGNVHITDADRFRQEILDRLTYTAAFGGPAEQEAARWIIWQAAWELGVQPASINALYQARAREAYHARTVPAINARGMTYDFARAIVRAARDSNVGAFIFELAKSETEYTFQRPAEYATVVAAASIREGHQGPIFIQADHYQASARKYARDPEAVIQELRELIAEAIAAGYLNIDIDTSTLVDLSRPTVSEQQRANFSCCAELAAWVRSLEPKGVTVSIGGEIGEVGKKNSTVEELVAFLEGFNREFAQRTAAQTRGLSKISVNTGTTHGGVVLPDGTIARVNIDFETLRNLSAAARRYGLGGAVQHGASTLPAEAFHEFPRTETLEVHLATEFQNIILDGGAFPEELKQEMYEFLRTEFADERTEDETDEQFLYKTRKKAWGPFKAQTWHLPDDTRQRIRALLVDKLTFLYAELGVTNTTDLVQQHVTPVRVHKPLPASLAVATAR